MPAELAALCIDANDPARVAAFWGGLLGWELVDDAGAGKTLLPTDGTGFRIRCVPSSEPKVVQNRMHLELTSESLQQQQETVARALDLGGRHVDVGQLPEEPHVVLGDPEGNELCVIEPGNTFLAGCGFVGSLGCDGTHDVGVFWSKALDWPLVWDQGEETAIRSPHGGPKLAWGGPPLMPKPGKNRLHFDIAPSAGSDQRSEVDKLISLGASRIDIGQGDVGWVVMADPDGNEFCVTDVRAADGRR